MAGKPRKPQALIAMEIETSMREHIAGRTYREIAQILNISPVTVGERIKAGIEMLVTPVAEQTRDIELARLDHYLARLTTKIEGGDLKAIETALKIQDRRAKMLGLDKPVQVEVSHSFPGTVEDEIARLEAELAIHDAAQQPAGATNGPEDLSQPVQPAETGAAGLS